MPRAQYPKPWVPIGCGSYRELDAERVQITWRPFGKAGPQPKRTLRISTKQAREFLMSQATTRSKRRVGVISITWAEALQLYRIRFESRGRSEKYTEEVFKILEELRDHVDIEIPEMFTDHVDAWLQSQATAARDKAAERDDDRERFNRTLNKKKAMVAAFFNWLKKTHKITDNPVSGVDSFEEADPERRTLSQDEYAAVYAVCEPPLRDLMDFLLCTSVRFGECAAMERAAVQVLQNTKTGETRAVWTIRKRKRKKALQIELDPMLLEIILRQPAPADPATNKIDGLVWHKSVDPLPGANCARNTDTTAAITDSWFRQVMKVRCKSAGIPAFSAHALRRTHATWAEETEGIKGEWIQKSLGHTQLSTTMKYMNSTGVAKRVQAAIIEVRRIALKDSGQQGLFP